jgi:hypothetical protein
MTGKCEHKNFVTNSIVNRLTNESGEVKSYSVDLEIHCLDCMTPFEFIGLPYGLNPSYPTTNIERVELRQPIKPITL